MTIPRLTRILYAEDDADIQTVVKMALESLGGLNVNICDSGLDVVTSALECTPDLILLDVMMPGLDGPGTLQALRKHEQLKEIPVIFVTAKVMHEELALFKKMGVIEVITKPFDPVALPERLQTIWATYHG